MGIPAVDSTIQHATKDEQTVTPAGEPVALTIDGVVVASPVTHADHRGRLFEIFPAANDFWRDPVVYSYCFTIRPLQIKGWGLHLEKDDRYTIIHGEMTVALYDARTESPTHGMSHQVTLSEQRSRQILIPAGVWHADVNVSETEVHVVNFPTQRYHHDNPDRYLLPWDSSEIPFDLASLFPIQTRQNVGGINS